MATVRIQEYVGSQQEYSQPVEPPAVVQTAITIGGASVASAAFAATTNRVRLSCDGACHILFGATPTATAAGIYLASGSNLVFNVVAGSAMKVAVIS